MIFVVGARRSGTQWIQRIIAAHPNVAAVVPETHLFSHGIEPFFARFHHGPKGSPTTGSVYVDRRVLLDATRDFCDQVFLELKEPDADRLVERSPLHGRHLELIADIYPDAHFVHVVRDGRDVARSLVAQEWGPTTIEGAAREWRSTLLGARKAGGRPGYIEVRYEELLRDTARGISMLYGDLDLKRSPPMVDAALSEAGIPGNVDQSAPEVGAGKWRGHLGPDEIRAIEHVAGDLLTELGYTDAPSDVAHRPEPVPAARRTVNRLRARLGSTGRRLGRRRGPSLSTRATVAQARFDELLSLAHVGGPDRLKELLHPDASVRLVGYGAGATAQTRGRAGHEAFAAAVCEDEAFSARQIRGDVYPGVPTVAAVMSYALPSGPVVQRALFVTFEADLVTDVALHRFPVASDPGD